MTVYFYQIKNNLAFYYLKDSIGFCNFICFNINFVTLNRKEKYLLTFCLRPIFLIILKLLDGNYKVALKTSAMEIIVAQTFCLRHNHLVKNSFQAKSLSYVLHNCERSNKSWFITDVRHKHQRCNINMGRKPYGIGMRKKC